jgi:hypothetical protein
VACHHGAAEGDEIQVLADLVLGYQKRSDGLARLTEIGDMAQFLFFGGSSRDDQHME